jgi:hypothetical protein
MHEEWGLAAGQFPTIAPIRENLTKKNAMFNICSRPDGCQKALADNETCCRQGTKDADGATAEQRRAT